MAATSQFLSARVLLVITIDPYYPGKDSQSVTPVHVFENGAVMVPSIGIPWFFNSMADYRHSNMDDIDEYKETSETVLYAADKIKDFINQSVRHYCSNAGTEKILDLI